ncbi:MAG: flavodoxin family protein [Chloroflexia bacterium]|nr:flavodoxin family protein [Chloroflexia bacterium]
MKQALIVYQSKTGTTKKFGFAIRDFLSTLDVEAKAIPVQNFVNGDAEKADLIFLGCWTSGLFVIFQHPDKKWSEFAQQLPDLKDKKVALFTTYKLLTGSMFKNMKQKLIGKISEFSLTLKAKGIELSDQDKENLKQFALNQN